MRFTGSADYVSTDDLTLPVNAAITLQRPQLVKGERITSDHGRCSWVAA